MKDDKALDQNYICPECDTCEFFHPHPFAIRHEGWWCGALREPSHNMHCGLYIEDPDYIVQR